MNIKHKTTSLALLTLFFFSSMSAEAGFFKNKVASLFKGEKKVAGLKKDSVKKSADSIVDTKNKIDTQLDSMLVKNINESLKKNILIASNSIDKKIINKKIKKEAEINTKGHKISEPKKKNNYTTEESFKDLPTSHWAYNAVVQLSDKGYLKGYADNTFKGNGQLTRYELSMVVSRLAKNMNGSNASQHDLELLKKLCSESGDNLMSLKQRINSLDVDLKDLSLSRRMGASKSGFNNIKVTGDMNFALNSTTHSVDQNPDDTWHEFKLGLNIEGNLYDKADFFARIARDKMTFGEIGSTGDLLIEEAWVELRDLFPRINEISSLKIGRQKIGIGNSIVLNDTLGGIKLSGKKGRISGSLFAFTSNNDNNNVNGQLYGDDFSQGFSETLGKAASIAAGNNPGEKFYIQADSATITEGGGNINFATGTGISSAAGWTYTPGDQITLNQAPYKNPNPQDSYTGSKTNSPVNWKYNNSEGIALYSASGNTRLLPVDQASVVGNWAPATALNTLDTNNTDSQNMALAAKSRDYQIDSEDGLDSWGFDINYRMDKHVVGAYFLQQHYYRFDPYTRLGDPWAAVTDYNGDNIPDTDVNGYDLSPESDPTYLGITFKGNLKHNLDYFCELVSFNPDINNIGVNVKTGTAKTNGKWNQNNLDNGFAWIGGLKYKALENTNFLVQLGSGNEEFVPAAIHEDNYLNGMKGRYQDSISMPTSFWPNYRGSGSLTGIRDLLLKADHLLNDKTKGIFTFEKVWENDSSEERLISGDSSITGHATQDYARFNIAFEHQYRPNTLIKLEYENLMFSDSAADDAHFSGNSASQDDDIDAGGYQTISGELSVNF